MRVLTAQLKRYKSSLIGANTVLDFQDIPSPKGLPIIGTTLALIAEGSAPKLHKYIDKRHKQLGAIFKEKLGPVSCVFISDPDTIRDVFNQEGKYPIHLQPEAWVEYNKIYKCPRGLFFMDGPNWWHYRRIMNSILLKGDIKWIQDSCDIVSDNFIKRLEKSGSDKCYQNLKGELYKWSLDIIVSILLGAESYQKHYHQLEEQVSKISQTVHLVFETTSKLSLISASFAAKFNIPQWKRFVNSAHGALKDSSDLVTALNNLNPSADGLIYKLIVEEMNLDDIKRIIVDLIMAAGDTTAVSFEWMLYLISKNKHIQEKLRNNPEMARFVMRECLRLYPIATFLTRILPADSVLAGYEVPKGTLVISSMYTSGRDERYFPEPHSFKPERWDRSNTSYNINMQKASLPFGMGLRSCIGRKIAEVQIQTLLMKIVNNFNVEIYNKKDVEIMMKMVAHPSEDLLLKFRKL